MAQTAPIRTPMHDAKGNLTRPWVLYFAAGGGTASSASSDLVVVGGVVSIDLSAGSKFTLTLTSAAAITFAAPVDTGGSISDGDEFKLYIVQDATGGWPCPAFTGGAGGFAADTHDRISSPPILYNTTAATQTSLSFTANAATVWIMDGGSSGGQLS